MDLGFSGEIIFLALLGLILFGPRKLPEIARKAGHFIDDLKRAGNEFQGQLKQEVESLTPRAETTKDDPNKNFLTSLMDDFRALNRVTQPARTLPAVPEPAQRKQEMTQTSLIDNVTRIKDLMAANGATNDTHAQEKRAEATESRAPS